MPLIKPRLFITMSNDRYLFAVALNASKKINRTLNCNCIKSSPFLASKTLRQLAFNERDKYPRASVVVECEFCMNDLVSSVSTLEPANMIYCELIELFKASGFDLAKWVVSSEAFIQEILLCNRSPDVIDFESDTLKILCFQWHLRFDEFLFFVQADARVCTKRNALSVFLVDLFDPLRFLSRVAVVIKLIIKYLWAVGLDCDKVTPITVLNGWQYYQEELYEMSSFPIPCNVGMFIFIRQ